MSDTRRISSWCGIGLGSGNPVCDYGPDEPCDVCLLVADCQKLRDALEPLTGLRERYAVQLAAEPQGMVSKPHICWATDALSIALHAIDAAALAAAGGPEPPAYSGKYPMHEALARRKAERDTAPPEKRRCARCGGTTALTCEGCGYGGTWLNPKLPSPLNPRQRAYVSNTLVCDHCGHEQPALCSCPGGPEPLWLWTRRTPERCGCCSSTSMTSATPRGSGLTRLPRVGLCRRQRKETRREPLRRRGLGRGLQQPERAVVGERALACARDRLLFPFRWLRDSARAWLLCERHGVEHEWSWNEDGCGYCEVCGIPGKVIE